MRLYITDEAVLLLGVIYMPVVLLALWLLWRKLPNPLPIRIGAVLIGAFIAAAIPLWDVAITSWQMAALCQKAGITKNRTVNVDGFYTNNGGADHLKRGFKFIEVKAVNIVKVYSRGANGIQIQMVDIEKNPYVPKSRYEFIFGDTLPLAGYTNIARTRSIVRDRVTSEELGDATRFTAYPGWVDRNTLALIGRIQWICPSDQDQDIRLSRQIIQPNK